MVKKVRGSQVWLDITADKDVTILREEIVERYESPSKGQHKATTKTK